MADIKQPLSLEAAAREVFEEIVQGAVEAERATAGMGDLLLTVLMTHLADVAKQSIALLDWAEQAAAASRLASHN